MLVLESNVDDFSPPFFGKKYVYFLVLHFENKDCKLCPPPLKNNNCRRDLAPLASLSPNSLVIILIPGAVARLIIDEDGTDYDYKHVIRRVKDRIGTAEGKEVGKNMILDLPLWCGSESFEKIYLYLCGGTGIRVSPFFSKFFSKPEGEKKEGGNNIETPFPLLKRWQTSSPRCLQTPE